MDGLRIAFIVLAVLNLLLNLIRLITEEEEKGLKFNASVGWFCAIVYAII
jgi:hypothetical protein